MSCKPYLSLLVIIVGAPLCQATGVAAEPVTLENVTNPGPNLLDEPMAADFSLAKAVHFLDSASLQWQKQRKCFTCHTNLAYLYARPLVPAGLADQRSHTIVREFAESMVRDRWTDAAKGPRWDAEVVAVAAALAFNDAHSTAALHPLTKSALDRMWTLQREDGGWDWLNCGWPPMESDDHYGATVAAIAAGVAPGDYRHTPSAQAGLQLLRQYLAANPPANLHQQAMLMWAASYHESLISNEQRKHVVTQLLELQKPDGGWALATLGNWERADDQQQDLQTSDGYATGFVAFVLGQAGLPRDDSRLLQGRQWLRENQRASGRWVTRSLNRDSKHFISHAGSAFAVMALADSP